MNNCYEAIMVMPRGDKAPAVCAESRGGTVRAKNHLVILCQCNQHNDDANSNGCCDDQHHGAASSGYRSGRRIVRDTPVRRSICKARSAGMCDQF